MPGNFGIPNEDASLDSLGGVIDANSDALEEIIVAAQYPLTALITDNDCLLDGIAKRAQRLLNTALKTTNTELANIANALVAHLGALTGATQEELNRALALADDAQPATETDGAQIPLAAPGPDIQDILEGGEDAGGDFDTPEAATASAPRKAAAGVAGFIRDPLGIEAQTNAAIEAANAAIQARINAANTKGDPILAQGLSNLLLRGVDAKAATQSALDAIAGNVPEKKKFYLTGCDTFELPEVMKGGLPLPGSKAFYEKLDEYIAGFDALGDTIIILSTSNNVGDTLRKLILTMQGDQSKLTKGQTLFVQAAMKSLLYLLDASVLAGDLVMELSTCAFTLGKQLMPQCNLKAVIAVIACKSVISVLREIQAGWDAFVWAIAKIHVELPHVESLLDHIMQYACPMEVPSPQEATEAWTNGYMDTAKRDTIYRWHGINPEGYKEVVESRSEMLGERDYIQFLRRQRYDIQSQIDAMKDRGYRRQDEANAVVEMYDELPTINDHLLWLRKNVFDDEYVTKYKLMDGFDERFWRKFGDDLTALGMRKEYAALHYAAHWIQPSPEQMREFVYRLRPDKVGDANAFTADDFERIMAEQDYSALARQWFCSTLYRVPALGYLRDMYRQGVIGDDELRGYHQDLGYSHDDSERFVRIDRIQRDRMRAAQAHGWNPAAIASAYGNRQRDAEWVKAQMEALGYTLNDSIALAERADAEIQGRIVNRARSKLLTTTVSQVTNALKVGVVDVGQAAQLLQQVGWPAELAQGVAQLQATQANVDRVKHAITQLRGAYHRGEVQTAFVSQQLQALGVAQGAIQSYLASWQIERTPARKRRRAAQIVTDLAEAQISTEEALVLLTNLGYEEPDRELYLADARRKMVHIEGSSNVLETLAGKSREEATMQLARHAGALSERLVKDLKEQVPLATLKKWAKLGTIPKREFVSRMTLYGFNNRTIELYWEEACSAKNAACEEPPPVPVTPPEPSQGAGANGNGTSGANPPVPE